MQEAKVLVIGTFVLKMLRMLSKIEDSGEVSNGICTILKGKIFFESIHFNIKECVHYRSKVLHLDAKVVSKHTEKVLLLESMKPLDLNVILLILISRLSLENLNNYSEKYMHAK